MTRDLEETLLELGPDARAVVERLLAASEMPSEPLQIPLYRRPSALLAASLVGLLLWAYLVPHHTTPAVRADKFTAPREYTLAHEATPAAIAEIVATQRPDGGWANDFLTRQNAAVLAACTDPASRLAYRKAMRNLRFKP